jgi:hypothetical protein
MYHEKGSRKSRRMGMNGRLQLLVYTNDVNLVDDNVDTIKKNTETI